MCDTVVRSPRARLRQLGGLLAALVATGGAAQPAALEGYCERVSRKVAGLSPGDCIQAGLQVPAIASVRGQPIPFRDFVPSDPGGDPPRVLLVGGVHGDELTSVGIVFEWMARLQAAADSPIHWRVVPLLNPDGLLDQPARRTNANGVDLNRNFPTPEWAKKAHRYWVRRAKRDPRRYPGKLPMSEPETQFVAAQIAEFQPHAVVQVHATFGLLDYDGPPKPPDRFGDLRLKQLGVYPGSLGNFAGVTLGLPVVTLELPHPTEPPSAAEQQEIWADMHAWLRTKLPEAAEPSLYEQVSYKP